MLKMILADDEPVITRGIQKLVDWKALGIEIIGAYEDGKAAFDNILMNKPDLALLDIYMPKKNGIDVLKEIRQLNINTKVIFISGFQDFEYARSALLYGAEGYLLKPVLRDELISTIERCTLSLRSSFEQGAGTLDEEQAGEELGRAAYDRLVQVEECKYRPVVVGILPEKTMSRHEKKLIQFSVLSFIETCLSQNNAGIIFLKNERIIMVLKDQTREDMIQLLYQMIEQVKDSLNCSLGAVIGSTAESMGEIPEAYRKCLDMEGYFYFAEEKRLPLYWLGEPVYRKQISMEDLNELRKSLIDALVAQDEERFLKYQEQLKTSIRIAADGRKDDACFHYGSTVRMIEERFEAMGLGGQLTDLKELLEQARNTENYRQMTELFASSFEQYHSLIRSSVMSNDKRDIIAAKEYIEKHYQENLTLEVLSGVVHMNSYYFSAFFKKHSGQNFKDYLNKVRMKHAVDLLVSSDKKAAEIADAVGFRDSRSFSELFQRFYNETPSSYRKRLNHKK